MSKKKGARAERAVVNALDRDGWTVVRTPSSGAATQRDLPDLLAGVDRETVERISFNPWGTHDQIRLAGEVKYRSDGRVQLDGDEVAALARFSRAFDALPAVITRWKNDTTAFVVAIRELDKTDGGNYSIGHEQSRQSATFVIHNTAL